ncbi:heat-inducible transcriptional repressor [Weissella uvarum]|uniref:heat-inducible transcriptional repressor HrcA n=1 Tax=Weissella uvarum TaxID=1479233 RepID=UPI001961DF53|nr:heat-inducible transcriptional repressor HrcA [Weissella uvarum]MBM7617111.1 heat-inducible transcriptional repressor [Weissella uvarum]MCM0595407.1 heat-inducible transcription repressor HrcA [Weissella uvarum]
MLTDRQRLILAAIVVGYAKAGKAVGSKTLLHDLQLSVSSATIRNEMAQLENQGLLQKEHTSSGRVPSQRGYRYYVDQLMDTDEHDEEIQQALHRVFARNFQQVDDLLQQSVDELVNLTGYTAIALKPEAIGARLSGFRLVPLDGQQILAIVVTNDGEVTSQSFRLPDGMQVSDLDGMVAYINNTLVDHLVVDVLKTLSGDLPLTMERVIRTPAAFLQLFGDVLARSISEKIFIGGQLNLLDYTDDSSLQDIKKVFELIQSPKAMRQAIGTANEGVMVQIGEENISDLLDNYSLVSATYHVPSHGAGAIAILGPTRMPYAKTVATVGQFRDALAQKLVEYY